ncbi:hypothetical protein RvY_12456 [Ramazzottius varieornatus]|uniref:Uncharacterized protein n=1 Tax=Ramazzottius varieornatus TaxID=947166 RepID=A0A1D1VJK2_RAMVA|nr:hypothetical protein RvY_12456 [Ramazzottius varieornatus]
MRNHRKSAIDTDAHGLERPARGKTATTCPKFCCKAFSAGKLHAIERTWFSGSKKSPLQSPIGIRCESEGGIVQFVYSHHLTSQKSM